MARVVVKLGTSVLAGEGAELDAAHVSNLAGQCAALHAAGHEIIICSSGAIALGRSRMGLDRAPRGLPERQMLAAVGQSRLMRVWEEAFDGFGIRVGQLLFTRADVEDRGRYLNARDALEAMLSHRVIPIANENDAVATAEIRLGDNDTLSALLAVVSSADLLILLTDQPGLFTADPRVDPEARLITDVDRIDDALRGVATDSVSGVGTGGMVTKIRAAEIAGRAGTTVVVASGHAPNVVERAMGGESVGTRFAATDTPLEHRKRWILTGPAPRATLVVDAGAVDALKSAGRSLLPAGVVGIQGAFERGDTVTVESSEGAFLARGIVRYDHGELKRILGVQSDNIAGVLGYSRGNVIIHRNDMVLEQ
jgi:glutamate 5-kinase